MPIYRYRCGVCKRTQDEFRTIDRRDDYPACHDAMERVIMPTMVSVFKSYMTAAIDKGRGTRIEIKSADEHRAFLRRNGYEEVGNDTSMAPRPPKPVEQDAAPVLSADDLRKQGWLEENLT
jgi:predicted nucleic acid-binding Zn ribbon protein